MSFFENTVLGRSIEEARERVHYRETGDVLNRGIVSEEFLEEMYEEVEESKRRENRRFVFIGAALAALIVLLWYAF